jgi:hypothetical protein
MKIIGVDSGAKGAICEIDTETHEVRWCNMPYTEERYVDIKKVMSFDFDFEFGDVWLERVNGGSKTKKFDPVSSFVFGQNFGMIFGGLMAVSEVNLVPAKTWQAHFYKLDYERNAKSQSLELFFKINPNFGKYVKCRHEGLVDAFLVALYGYHTCAIVKRLPFTFTHLG